MAMIDRLGIEQATNSDVAKFRTVAFETLAAVQRINELMIVQLEEERWRLEIRMKEVSNAYHLARIRLQWELEKKLKFEQKTAEQNSHVNQAALAVEIPNSLILGVHGMTLDDTCHTRSEIEAGSPKIATEAAIEAANSKIATLEIDVADREHQRNECDCMIKMTEKRLIEAQDVCAYIMLLQAKYTFLRDDIQVAMEPDDVSVMSQCTQDFRQLALPPDELRLELESSFSKVSAACSKTDLSVIDQLATIDDVTTFCAVAYEVLAGFRCRNKRDRVRLEQECQRLKYRLIESSTEHSLASSRLEKERKKQLEVNRRAASQASEIASFEATIRQEEASIKDLERKITEHNQRDVLNEIIGTVASWIGVASGNVEAMKERKDRVKEDAKSRRQQLNDTRDAIAETRFAVSMLETEAAYFQSRMDECDRELKVTGIQLTEVQNVRILLEQLRSEYEFLQDKVQITKILDDASVMIQCVQDFRQLPPSSLHLEPELPPIRQLDDIDRLPTMDYVAAFCDVVNELLEHMYAQDVVRLKRECDDLRGKLGEARGAHRLAFSPLQKKEEEKLDIEGKAVSQAQQIDYFKLSIQRAEAEILESANILPCYIDIGHPQSCIKEANEKLNRLRPQLSGTRDAIAEVERAIDSLRIEADFCQSQVEKYDRSLKATEKLLAQLKDARAFPMQLRAKYMPSRAGGEIARESEDSSVMSQRFAHGSGCTIEIEV